MSNLDKYLAMKRAQQVTTVNPVMIAPSPMDRYGLRSQQQPAAPLPTYPGPMRPGMPSAGAMQRIGNTGPGPDGVVQPNRPVAIVDAGRAGYEGGRTGAQTVHEGEDISRGPNGDIRVTPAAQSQVRPGEQPVTPPGATQSVLTPQDQARMAMIERKAGMPGMASGTGVLIKPVNSERTGEGYNRDLDVAPTPGTSASQEEVNANYAASLASAASSGIKLKGASGSKGTGGGRETKYSASGIAMSNEAVPRSEQSIAFSPTAISGDESGATSGGSPKTETVSFKPTAITGVPEVPEVPVPTSTDGSTVYSPSKIDQAILNYYQPRLAASQNAERAAEAQALQQQGASAETIQGQQAVSDVSRRSAMGEMVSQFGQKALEGEATRQDTAAAQRLAERSQSLAEQQYADTAQTRLATDIANGMSFEDAQAKYGSTVLPDQAAYNRVSVTAGAARRTAAYESLGSYADQQVVADPTYVSSGAWKDDKMMTTRLSDVWGAEGMEGEFDPGNVAHEAWAESQLASLTMTPEQAAINRTRSSSWYQALDADEKGEVDDLLNFAQTAAITGGYTLGENEDGSVFLMDADGEVVSGTRSTTANGGTGGVTSAEASDLVTYLGENGTDTTTSRARQYLLEHPDEPNPSPEDWAAWDSSAPNSSNIMKFLNGDAVTLSAVDQNHLTKIMNAQAAVRAGTATAEETKLASSISQQISEWNWGTTTNKTSGEYNWSPGAHVGEIHRSVKVNSEVYQSNDDKSGASFEQPIVDWAEANRGNVVMLDGVAYRLSATQPIIQSINEQSIVSGDDTYTQRFTFDALNLIRISDGEPVEWTADATGVLRD